MITKEVTAFGMKVMIGCDAKCDRAFGINGRPKEQLSDDPDDYAFLSDDKAGVAPESGKTKIVSEGGDMKPVKPEERLNRWCCRECERCEMGAIGEEIWLKDWSKPVYNMMI
ncbi:hypothetical protein JOD82_002229 [Paenibacillus sp. 1182]|uniref:hypothetical protein n=1 Tax=Paenibacillus sp. 1182 TaxID=2806565 RepID=UPI001B70B237|nr:hypothetical protein [Paenibacillus sp. 1182]MBP1309209.1 hypothetical protein [Paenibacillus sp. 1182]